MVVFLPTDTFGVYTTGLAGLIGCYGSGLEAQAALDKALALDDASVFESVYLIHEQKGTRYAIDYRRITG